MSLIARIPTTWFKAFANKRANVALKKQIYHQYIPKCYIEFISSNGSRKVIMHSIEANPATNPANDVKIK
jgi:hypothetical protein